jgi:hypothetical protein
MISGLLFDVKSFKDITRVADEWFEIQKSWDVERFLDYFCDFWR